MSYKQTKNRSGIKQKDLWMKKTIGAVYYMIVYSLILLVISKFNLIIYYGSFSNQQLVPINGAIIVTTELWGSKHNIYINDQITDNLISCMSYLTRIRSGV